MKSSNLTVFKVINEAIGTVTSREKLRRLLATPLYANSLYLMGSTGVMSLCGFFFWLIVARLYPDAVVGYSSAIISALNLLAIMSLGGLNISLVRFLPQADNPSKMINTCFTLGGLISLLMAGVFLAGLGIWSPALSFIRQNTPFCLAFFAFAVLWTVSPLADAAFLAKRRAGFGLARSTLFSLLRLPLPLLLALHFKSFGVVASWGIALAASLVVALAFFLPKAENSYRPLPALDPGVIKTLWRYSSGNYVANLLSAAPAFVLPLMVVNRLGAEENAYFYIAWMMANLLFAIALGVSRSLFAEGSHFEDRLRENVIKSLKSTFMLLIPAAVLLAAAGQWLLLAFGQGYSANALALLLVLCLSSLPHAVNHIYTGVLWVTGRIRELIGVWGFIAIVTLVASYVLLPRAGLVGIGYAWLGANAMTAIGVITRRRLTRLPPRQVRNNPP